MDLSEPGLIRLGFRLTNSKFDGVVSLAVRPEITGPNRLSLTVEGLFAGVLPLDPAQFAPQVSAQLNRYGVRHRWERLPGNGEGRRPPRRWRSRSSRRGRVRRCSTSSRSTTTASASPGAAGRGRW